MDRDQQQQQDEQQQEPVLRSIHNRHSAFVRFINTTQHSVGVYWIDYQGKEVCYKVLGCRDYLDINTFETHPWIFIDEETRDRYRGNGQVVYFPQPWIDKYRRMARSGQPVRIGRTYVYISQPLFSLRDLCLRVIKRMLRMDCHAYGLEIPWSLQRELYSMYPRKPDPRLDYLAVENGHT